MAYSIEQLKESIRWIERDTLRLKDEIHNFDKGKNPILENDYKKKISQNDKLRESLLLDLTKRKGECL